MGPGRLRPRPPPPPLPMSSRLEHFQGLVARQPENELFHFSLAQALAADGRGTEALPHLLFCTTRRADWMMPRILLGKALLQAGRQAEARPCLEEALRLAVEQAHEDPERELRALLADLPPSPPRTGAARSDG